MLISHFFHLSESGDILQFYVLTQGNRSWNFTLFMVPKSLISFYFIIQIAIVLITHIGELRKIFMRFKLLLLLFTSSIFVLQSWLMAPERSRLEAARLRTFPVHKFRAGESATCFLMDYRQGWRTVSSTVPSTCTWIFLFHLAHVFLSQAGLP